MQTASEALSNTDNSRLQFFTRLVPGLLLAGAVSAAAFALEALEVHLTGHRYVENLVLAILLGTVIRSAISLPAVFHHGIKFSEKFILEVAIVLLGASISVQALKAAGPVLVVGIIGTVSLAILVSYSIGRGLGLKHKLATLVACGNSICGNSAIAAAAPVIDAEDDDVAAAIAFTAVLGVIMVLALPLALTGLGMTPSQYGVLSGLTVYAVPQVLAAAQPGGMIAVQTGTLVKLIRVMMLGPVLFALGISARAASRETGGAKVKLKHIAPWFIIGFAIMMALRSVNAIPDGLVVPLAHTSNALTVIAMAALGLSVDVRSLGRAGGRVVLTAVLSIGVLTSIALGLIFFLQIG
ncbi:YeiH family protein [Martelella mediterranea]|uniref:Putative integral membrane protein (TIGR00698 family) n=1 Tax=Martelella mediterranea TaxID=293089 RepID=A0A4R3P042_9HYPH|nr:putative sulfate exporter family transporter [Martelella mediterranea]TCT38830.1 putative integral membrane protein (TIGR00698 family) [Martelella mediterranea]